MAVDSRSRRPLPRGALATLGAAVLPGGRVGRVRRLGGGLASTTHAVDLIAPSAEPLRLVLRRYGGWRLANDPDAGVREWRVLTLLRQAGVPVPEPVWLDASGEVFGGPALVTTRLPGRGLLRPRDPAGWARQLGEALAAIHCAPAPDADLSVLIDQRAELDALIGHGPPPSLLSGCADTAAPPGSDAIWSALRHWWPRIERGAPGLVHGDYWAGNTLWRRGRLTGVVDWEQPRRGAPGQDVGFCRVDLGLLAGAGAPQIFLHAYETAAGRQIPHLFFWDLLAATWALPDPARWMPAYHALGRTDFTPELMRGHVRAFIADALARAG